MEHNSIKPGVSSYVKCAKCGKIAKTDKSVIPYEIGTKTVMKCKDCCDDSGYAKLCRACCPTAHGTKFEGE